MQFLELWQKRRGVVNIRRVWGVTAEVSRICIIVESLLCSKDPKDKSILPCHEAIGIGRCIELFDHDLF